MNSRTHANFYQTVFILVGISNKHRWSMTNRKSTTPPDSAPVEQPLTAASCPNAQHCALLPLQTVFIMSGPILVPSYYRAGRKVSGSGNLLTLAKDSRAVSRHQHERYSMAGESAVSLDIVSALCKGLGCVSRIYPIGSLLKH